MNCAHCGLPLDEAQEHGGDKSCPHCSQHSTEHIFYPRSSFGFTEKRVTPNNPEGVQSWCTRCRGHENGPYADGKKCSEF